MPLLRPLVGFDKEEITREAQQLGTYQISVIPDEDCCTLFTPRFPATRAAGGRRGARRSANSTSPVWSSAPPTPPSIEDFRFPDDKIAPRWQTRN